MRISPAENLRFPGEGSSTQGKSGPKARLKSVVDGQQVEIPVLQDIRTVGTQRESESREWKNRCKRSRVVGGKSPTIDPKRNADRTKVGKLTSQLSRKAAIVYLVPVP